MLFYILVQYTVYSIVRTSHCIRVHLKLNCGAVGFYRVNYTKSMRDALIPAIVDRSLPARDRLLFVNDMFALVSI